jgi:hypothetical protein
MTIFSYTEDGSSILGVISTEIDLSPIGGGDYKIGFLSDINLEISEVPTEVGETQIYAFVICRHTFVCNEVNVNISASSLCLSPLNLGSYCMESFGYKKNPGFLSYLNQELISTVSFTTRDELGDYPGDSGFPYGYDGYPISGCVADTIYFRFNGADPHACTHKVEYLARRALATSGYANPTYFSYADSSF